MINQSSQQFRKNPYREFRIWTISPYFASNLVPKMRVVPRSWVTVSPQHVIARNLSALIHPCGCWGEAREPFPTPGAVASTPFYGFQDLPNLSKSPQIADSLESTLCTGRTLVWKVVPGGATTNAFKLYSRTGGHEAQNTQDKSQFEDIAI